MANEIQVKGELEEREIQPYCHRAKIHEINVQGFVHHSNYYKWMEDARMDLMEQLGLGYKQMEEMEVIMKELSVSIEYRNEVIFNQKVMIETKLLSYDGKQMEIAYHLYDKETGDDIAVARSKHCFQYKSGLPISMKRIYPELDTKFFQFK